MAKSSPIQYSFNGGELSPDLKGRIDLLKYKTGCEKLRNFTPQVHGPVKKRPGTRNVYSFITTSDGNNGRLIPFIHDNKQSYMLEFFGLNNGLIRFYKDGGIVLDGTTMKPIALSTIYANSDLPDLQYAQSADVLYITHPNHPVQELSRLSHDTWEIKSFMGSNGNLNNRPPMDAMKFFSGGEAIRYIPDAGFAATGVLHSTVSGKFVPSDEGSIFQYKENPESKYDTWTSQKNYFTNDLVVYNGNVYRMNGGTGISGTRPPIHTAEDYPIESDGNLTWVFLYDGTMYFLGIDYIDSSDIEVLIINPIPFTSIIYLTNMQQNNQNWSESAWKESKGYPKTVVFYEDRLWFAGTKHSPQTIWGSATGDYGIFKLGSNDNDGLSYTINSRELNPIEFLVSGKVLMIGTSSSEFVMSASSFSEAITPTNVKIVHHSSYGSDNKMPLNVGGAVLFVQRSGKKIREFLYNFGTDSYESNDLTILAEHLLQVGIRDISYQQEPNQTVWIVLNPSDDIDYNLVGITYNKQQEVIALHRHHIRGELTAVATIPHWDGDQDSTWILQRHQREQPGDNWYMEIMYIDKYKTDEYAFFVDEGLSYDGPPETVFSGLLHLRDQYVSVLADGKPVGEFLVSSIGVITLDEPASIVSAGLPMEATLKTMPIESGAKDGVAQGKTMRIDKLVVRLNETGLKETNPETNPLNKKGLFFGVDEAKTALNEATANHFLSGRGKFDGNLFTGDTEAMPFDDDPTTTSQITIQHKLPLPCKIVALMPQVTTYDR